MISGVNYSRCGSFMFLASPSFCLLRLNTCVAGEFTSGVKALCALGRGLRLDVECVVFTLQCGVEYVGHCWVCRSSSKTEFYFGEVDLSQFEVCALR